MPACQSAAGADSGPTAAGGQPQAEGEAQPERAPVTDSDPRRHGGAPLAAPSRARLVPAPGTRILAKTLKQHRDEPGPAVPSLAVTAP